MIYYTNNGIFWKFEEINLLNGKFIECDPSEYSEDVPLKYQLLSARNGCSYYMSRFGILSELSINLLFSNGQTFTINFNKGEEEYEILGVDSRYVYLLAGQSVYIFKFRQMNEFELLYKYARIVRMPNFALIICDGECYICGYKIANPEILSISSPTKSARKC